MNVKEAIEKRRSVRKYKSKKVSSKIINELINAARIAPSAKNAQPWKFKFIVNNKKVKEKLKNLVQQPFVCEAPLVIICCSDPREYPNQKENKYYHKNPEKWALVDLSIACQNLVLRATELGLGTCYVGLIDEKGMRDLFKIPKDYLLPYIITLGYPAEEPEMRPRKNKKEILI